MFVKKKHYTTLILSGTFREGPLQSKSILNRTSTSDFRYDLFLSRIDWILRTKSVSRIIVEHRHDFAPRLFAGAEAVRRELQRLREAGKELHFVSSGLDDLSLYIASVADRRYLHPTGAVTLRGLSRDFLFARRLLEREGVTAHVHRRGKYKSAGDLVRADHLEDATREEYQCYLDSVDDVLLTRTADALGTTAAKLRGYREEPHLLDSAAREAGFCDELGSAEDLREQWKKEKYAEKKARRLKPGFGKGARIAVVVLEGTITEGSSRRLPFMGQAIGSRSTVETLKVLRTSKKVRAVVARINSPGGSAVASDEIRHELARLAEKKPLVLSMSEVAGSGGYWIATVGRRLFAEETTLTGSIGVIAATLDASDMMRREGVTGEAVRTAPLADVGAAYRRPTDEELRIAEAEVDQYYRAFLDHVASFRKASPEEIDEVAQGRIWSGRDAVDRGLVDAVGGLRDALEAARGEIAAKKTRVDFYPRAKLNLVERLIAGGVSARLGDALTAALSGTRPGAALDTFGWTALQPHSLHSLHSLHPLHVLVRYVPFVSGRPLAVVPELWDMWRNT